MTILGGGGEGGEGEGSFQPDLFKYLFIRMQSTFSVEV